VRTYKLDAVISNCCNNFGPGQFPEKLIPTLIYNIITNKPLPIYGKGKNSREWIYVEDHCNGLFIIYRKGKIGESYNIGTNNNVSNLNLTKILLKIIKNKDLKIEKKVKIKFVKDRPGHDFRYALNSKKIRKELNWKPKMNFKSGLEETFNWYLNNFEFFSSFSRRKFFKRIGLIK
jgi:dTDP-glucose 4,6-dehydratase